MLEVGKYYRFLYYIKCHSKVCETELCRDHFWVDKNSVALLLEAPTKSKYPHMFYLKFLQEGKIYYVNYASGSDMDTSPQMIFKHVDK